MTALLASVLPRVEDPIPETIGLGTVFAIAGACGVIGAILGGLDRLRTREEHNRDWWTSWGLATGLFIGTVFYLLSLIAQVLS